MIPQPRSDRDKHLLLSLVRNVPPRPLCRKLFRPAADGRVIPVRPSLDACSLQRSLRPIFNAFSYRDQSGTRPIPRS